MSTPTVPETIGRYEVVGRLAVGGMATILLGRLRGPRGFEQPVVIKRILPHLATLPEFVDMFVDEARVVASIRHPNVVHVHELGHDGDELFLVMEYLEGESVGGLMRRLISTQEQLERPLAVHIIAQACAGLHAAHELTDAEGRSRGLVHRDISPQNVFVTYAGMVKVLDFGIAKTADRQVKTETGLVKGKFEYMSPEQCASKPLDRRSDVFALGILLYELTTGKRLFKRDNELSTLKAICEEPLRLPSEVVAGYPPVLEAICKRALARKPAERYATAADMRRDLVAALRRLDAELLPEDALSRLMQRVFAPRVTDKREMLRLVREGSRVQQVPAADSDLGVDIPFIEEASVLRSSTSDVVSTEPRRGRRILLPLGFAAAFATAVVLFAYRQQQPVALEPAQAVPFESTTSVPDAPTAVVAPAPSPDVVLQIETTPPGARIVVAGRDHGVTPAEVHVQRGEDALPVEIEKSGYRPVQQTVVPSVDHKLVLTLDPLPRRRSAPPPPATSSSSPGYRRFQ